MSYGIKYQSTFDRVDKTGVSTGYTLQILEKDYGGAVTDVVCAGVPVIHQWQTDEPKAPIKGSSLSINLVNSGSLPLEDFFSIDDDQFQVQFFWGFKLMFIGFLVQDDCSEPLFDFTHEINLSANDNLGLLKDIALDKAKITYRYMGGITDVWSTTASHTLTLPAGSFADSVQVGDVIHIHGLVIGFDFDFTVTDISGNPSFIIVETVTTGAPAASDSITLYRPILHLDKVKLAELINNCLIGTGLELHLKFFCNFQEVNQDLTKCFIEEILIDLQTFLKGNDYTNYDNCYAILEKVLARFNCTLFQAKGVWNIVHWDELRYSGYPVPGFEYNLGDFSFGLLGAIKLNEQSFSFAGFNKFLIEPFDAASIPDVFPETGLLHRILRPFQFVKETFNYKQPAQLLRNFDLQTLGLLLNTSTTGSGVTLQTINEYVATWWDPSARLDAGSGTYFIRVTKDYLDNEIERVLVVTHDVKSYKIEANIGDTFRYSFSFKTQDSQAGVVTIQVYMELYDGTTTQYLHDTGWAIGAGYPFVVLSGDNTNVWHTVEIDSSVFPVPYDGILTFYLRIADLSAPVNETYYKDIRLEYFYNINESTKIIGQTHKTEQTAVIKQNQDTEIFIDSSPRNSIAGTLFLNSMTGLLQDKTARWFLDDPSDVRRLGDLTTFETLFWRRIVRSILEGTLRGLVSADTLGDHISMLSVFNCSIFPDVNYIWGKLEIDYKNNKCTGTLWEIYDEGEVDADLTSTYEFKYLYETK